MAFMQKKRINLFMVFFILLPVASLFTIAADMPDESGTPNELSLIDLGYESDDTIHGVLVSREYAFRWPAIWQPKPGNIFKLEFSHSPVLDPVSTMSIEFNGSRLTSILLTDENVTGGVFELEIPEQLITEGTNRIRLVFYMGLYDFNCRDLDDPAVWTTVHNTSKFHFSYDLKRPDYGLSAFPFPFIPTSQLANSPVTFVLSDRASASEINAAVSISAKLGQLAPWWHVNELNTISVEEYKTSESLIGNVIIVGKIDHLVSLFALPSDHLKIQNGEPIIIDNRGASVASEAGVLWMDDSKFDETGIILYVTGQTDEAVMLAGNALSNDSSFPMLTGKFGVVLSTPPAPTNSGEIKQLISFETLGFEDRTAYGTFEQSLVFRIPQPIMWTIQYGAALDLHFAHTDLANSDESFLTVLLNGTPVESILLTEDNAKDAHQVINLPARLFAPGGNSLEIISNITVDFDRDSADYLNGKLDCLHDDDTEDKAAWLVVYADSELGLPGEQQSVLLDLSDFPAAFIGAEDLSELSFILPDMNSLTTIGSALRIAEYIGQYAEGPVLFPRVYFDRNLGEGSFSHQVLIGRPSENSAISNINSKLPQPFITGSDTPKPVDALVQIAPQDDTVGYIQAVTGVDGESIIIFTGTNDDGVSIASNAFLNPEYAGDIAGDLSIVSSEGLVSAVDIFDEEVRQSIAPPVESEDVEPEEYPRQTIWIYWLAGSILLITVVILIVTMYFNRKTEQQNEIEG